MTPDPAVPPLHPTRSLFEEAAKTGTFPSAVLCVGLWVLSGELDDLRNNMGSELDRLRDGITAQLQRVENQMSRLELQVDAVEIQTAQLPALEARVRALEEERRTASQTAPRR